jgi:F-type H+-transporting ATPase subunit a
MMFASGFSWFQLAPGVSDDTLLAVVGITEYTYVHLHAWLACFAVIVFAVLARMGLEAAKKRQGLEKYYADESFSPRNLAEVFTDGFKGIMGDILAPADIKIFFPFIGSLFLYIFACNIMGIFPGFLPPTDNINTNAGMAGIVFLMFNFVGLKRDWRNYVSHLMGPVLFLAPFMLGVELISLVVRPVALTIRLTGNMFGDHTVFTIMSELTQWVIPCVFLLLAMLVSTIQAFVFSLLTTIYIGLSVPHHDHDEVH